VPDTRAATAPTHLQVRGKPKDSKFQPAPPNNSRGTEGGGGNSRGGRLAESKHSLSNLPFTSKNVNLKNQGHSVASKRGLRAATTGSDAKGIEARSWSAGATASRPVTSSQLQQDGTSGWSAGLMAPLSSSQTPDQQSMVDDDYFSKPPLINRFSRTKGAELDPDSQLRSSVDRIGSNYTPPASKLAFSTERGIVCVSVEQWRELSAQKIVTGVQPLLASSQGGSSGEAQQGWRLAFPLSTVSGSRVFMDMNLGQYNRPHGRTSDIKFTDKNALQNITSDEVLLQSHDASENPASRAAYEWYLLHGISKESVAEPNAALNFHLIDNLPALSQLQAIPSSMVEEFLRTLFEEVRSTYRQSVKKSILDYMLRNKVTRERVGIQAVPHDYLEYHWWEWGLYRLKFNIAAEVTSIQQPMFHTELCRRMQSIEYGLKWMDKLTLSISSLWSKYENLLLVDVPSTDEEAFKMKWSPMEISEFETRQENAAKVCLVF
jgi:hypothetical protein